MGRLDQKVAIITGGNAGSIINLYSVAAHFGTGIRCNPVNLSSIVTPMTMHTDTALPASDESCAITGQIV